MLYLFYLKNKIMSQYVDHIYPVVHRNKFKIIEEEEEDIEWSFLRWQLVSGTKKKQPRVTQLIHIGLNYPIFSNKL